MIFSKLVQVGGGLLWGFVFLLASELAIGDDLPITYSEHVAPIVYEKCLICHRNGSVGPFELVSYQDVKRRSQTISAVLKTKYMPPWKPVNHNLVFSNDRSLSEQETQIIMKWIEEGCLEGDSSKLPKAPEFADGWTLGKPDLVVKMAAPFAVPADGPDVYRSFVFPVNLPEDRWVKAIELRPQAKSAVHHALFFLDTSGNARRLDGADGIPGIAGMGFLADFSNDGTETNGGLLSRLTNRKKENGNTNGARIDSALARGLGGYVPGAMPTWLPGDLAMSLPAQSDIIMQTHFHPTGKAESEQAELALYFAKEPPSKMLVPIQVPPLFGFGADLDIPAGVKDFTINDSFTLPIDVDAISVGGHAHYICREMEMTAIQPNGESIALLTIDDWDLDWQDRYLFKQPVHLPAGTRIESRIVYDNSEQNPENPFQPPQRIRWGRQSNDEMGSVTLLVVATDESQRTMLTEGLREYFGQAITGRLARGPGIGKLLLQLDENRDGKLQKDETPPRLSDRAFQFLDKNNDKALDQDELSGLSELMERAGIRPGK